MKTVTVHEVPADAQLIDVRELDEWAADRAAGAVHIPMSEFVARAGEIDDNRAVYLICKVGGRSAQVGQYLEQKVENIEVINVDGGTDAWRDAGLPMG
ncbi:rhodanese-like domain-containing protein [Corynebacterium sp. A21]|uniref:rhodanese-like domain-containing protein n=1 Tax=Corynebacterium sp. A21 TaxID=3457318 RepID=UPI003FCFC613